MGGETEGKRGGDVWMEGAMRGRGVRGEKRDVEEQRGIGAGVVARWY